MNEIDILSQNRDYGKRILNYHISKFCPMKAVERSLHVLSFAVDIFVKVEIEIKLFPLLKSLNKKINNVLINLKLEKQF